MTQTLSTEMGPCGYEKSPQRPIIPPPEFLLGPQSHYPRTPTRHHTVRGPHPPTPPYGSALVPVEPRPRLSGSREFRYLRWLAGTAPPANEPCRTHAGPYLRRRIYPQRPERFCRAWPRPLVAPGVDCLGLPALRNEPVVVAACAALAPLPWRQTGASGGNPVLRYHRHSDTPGLHRGLVVFPHSPLGMVLGYSLCGSGVRERASYAVVAPGFSCMPRTAQGRKPTPIKPLSTINVTWATKL